MEEKVKIGDIIDVDITGIQPYGAFALLPDRSTGLIHISEISERFVRNIESFVHVGEKIRVKVIDIDENSRQAKLSLKAVDQSMRRKNKRMTYHAPRKLIVETPNGFKPLKEHLEEWIKAGIITEEEI